MREWWWKIGFTPRAIRHVRRNWLFSSLDAISSYLWVISLIVASWGTSTQFTFLKHPPLGPQMTTSGKMHGTHTLIYARTHMQLKLTNHTKHTHAAQTHESHTHTCSSNSRITQSTPRWQILACRTHTHKHAMRLWACLCPQLRLMLMGGTDWWLRVEKRREDSSKSVHLHKTHKR